MLLDFAADKVINKYQTATCDELKAQKKQPPTDKEKEAVEFLRNDSQARIFFINKIAAPVLNKMFDCGMIHQGKDRPDDPEPLYPHLSDEVAHRVKSPSGA